MDQHETIINSYISDDLNIAIDNIKISGDSIKVDSGSGRILSCGKGLISLEMQTQTYQGTFGSGVKPGELIGEENYFNIEALSQDGLKVDVDRVRPKRIEGSTPGFTKLIFFPYEVLLQSSYPVDTEINSLTGVITYLDDLPSNEDYEITNNNPVFGYQRLNQWFNMEIDSVHFGLIKDDSDICRLAVWADSKIDVPLEDFADSFLQAMSFRYGCDVKFLAYTKRIGNVEATKLRTYKVQSKKFYPPLPPDFDRILLKVKDTEIDFFRKATIFFLNKNNKSILLSLAMCWNSTVNYLSNQSLIVGVSVERFVNNIIELYPPKGFKEDEKKFTEYKKQIEDVVTNEYNLKSEIYFERIVNGIRSFSFLNTQEKIKRINSPSLLVDITEDEIRAWKKMRNPLAHGETNYNYEDQNELQESLDNLAHTANILNKLMLMLINYEGPFINYSKRGWPTEKFELPPSS